MYFSFGYFCAVGIGSLCDIRARDGIRESAAGMVNSSRAFCRFVVYLVGIRVLPIIPIDYTCCQDSTSRTAVPI